MAVVLGRYLRGDKLVGRLEKPGAAGKTERLAGNLSTLQSPQSG